MVENIRILLVDDHAIVREGQRALLDTEPGMEVVGEAKDGVEAVELTQTLQPAVILMDLHMPRKDGLAAITEIKAENPAARILVLTSFTEDEKVYAAIKAGAIGYLMKDALPQEILSAVRQVHQGETSMHSLFVGESSPDAITGSRGKIDDDREGERFWRELPKIAVGEIVNSGDHKISGKANEPPLLSAKPERGLGKDD